MEEAQTNAGEAERLWRLARDEVEFLTSHAGTEGLRDAFLARPEIRRVLAHTGRLERAAS